MSAEVILARLYAVIEARKGTDPRTSYTASLHTAGLDAILQKVGEEAVETLLAAKNPDDPALIHETADLLYHLLVMLSARAIPLEAVWAELARRETGR